MKHHLHHLKRHSETLSEKLSDGWKYVKHNKRLFGFGLGTALIILFGVFLIWIATFRLPALDSFSERRVENTTKIYDRTGKVVLYDVYETAQRTVVPSEAIDPKIKQAIVAIEDKEFYNHHGIVVRSIIRAIASQFLPSVKQSGGSTITQQLIKNTLLTQERNLTRKLKEWVLAIKLERVMSKDEILTAYLNEAPYGGRIYGVEEASQAFFGKPAKEVTLAEAAYLASIPNLPTYYSPYGANRPNLNARKNLVLRSMRNQGMITDEEYSHAAAEEVEFRPQSDGDSKAIHFVEYIRSYLEEKYGREQMLYGGLQVITTLDWDIQQEAERTVKENALRNEELYGASNSAAVAIDPKTGQILAMVGSRDYSDRDIDGAFNVALANRQPGSSFKPIVYARAFEKGFQPETVIFDIPTQFGPCGAFDRSMTPPCYAPNNHDGKFFGPMNLTNALGQSRNIPAVKMLAMVGVADALSTAKRLGITTMDRTGDRYGLTLVIGGGEVTLLDLTSVYGVFANNGVRNPHTGILEIKTLDGTVLEKFTPRPEIVMSPDATAKLSYVLSNNAARAPLFGANSFMYFGESRPVAAKTGTTNDNKDAWVVGYSPSVAVGVWTGNNDNSSMRSGSSLSGPAWRDIMEVAFTKVPYEAPGRAERFPAPGIEPGYDELAPVLRGQWAGGESFFIDTISEKLATEFTPRETKKEFVIPDVHSILYWVDVNNVRGPRPTNPESNPQFERWEAGVQAWVASNPGIVPGTPNKPTRYDDVHTPENQPNTQIDSPRDGEAFRRNGTVTIEFSTQSRYSVKNYEIYLNNQLIGSTTNDSFSFIPSEANASPGSNTIKVITIDEVYNRSTVEQVIIVQ